MLRLSIVFLVLATVAGLFGFGAIANCTYDFAKILFFVFIVLSVLTLLSASLDARPPRHHWW